MKKQTDVAIEAHIIRGASYLRLLVAGTVMAFFGRRTSGRQTLIPVRAYKGDFSLPTDELTLGRCRAIECRTPQVPIGIVPRLLKSHQ